MEVADVARATQVFLQAMRLSHARRYPDRPNRVPAIEDLTVVDRRDLMTAIAQACKAATTPSAPGT